jgi:hypothetical protein
MRLLQNTSDMCTSFRTLRYKNVEKRDIFYSGCSVFLVSLIKEQSDSVKACRQAGVAKWFFPQARPYGNDNL